MKPVRRPSILHQISGSAAVAVAVSLLVWSVGAGVWLFAMALEDIESEADHQVKEVGSTLAPLLWNFDSVAIQTYLDTKLENPDFAFLNLQSFGGLQQWSAPAVPRSQPGVATVQRTAEISFNNIKVGNLTLMLTVGPRQKLVIDQVLILSISQCVLLAAVLAALAGAWKPVAARLRAMLLVMEEFSQHIETSRMDVSRPDELGMLSQGFNTMADHIRSQTQSMEREIQERTERLMESEKLALVGSLVAGVAHEINTPIGNGITVVSWLAGRSKEVAQKRAGSTLPPEELTQYLADVETTLQILQSGLDRTSHLIQTFKKIGADQVVDERRPIQLAAFLNEVVVSLQPTLKRFPHKVVQDCPPDLVIDNHPGALFQVVTNLVLNAHVHAFRPDAEGTIWIHGGPASEEDDFELLVKDNGAGMTPEVQARVFQPFFTTRRQQGGTGLGLSITHNLVQSLGGSISVTSAPGQGSTFHLVLPRKAPDRPA